MPDEAFGETPVNAFDMFEGANFKLKMRKVGGFANFDQSTFDSVSAVADDESKIEAIWKKTYSLKEFISKDKFKSYDELKTRFERFLNNRTEGVSDTAESVQPRQQSSYSKKVEDEEDDMPVSDETTYTARQSVEDDSDDTLREFQNLLA